MNIEKAKSLRKKMIPTNTQQGQIAKFMRMEQGLGKEIVSKRMHVSLCKLSNLESGRAKWTRELILAFCEAISKEE